MSRYPGYSVAHVTRQGIRDHTGHSNHTVGVGEFHDGFIKILKDGELKSVFGRYLQDGTRREAVAKFLGLEAKSEEEARFFLGSEIEGRFGDLSSVHFAIGRAQDDAYGGEAGNEIYFTFPSAFIAKNFYYQGGLASISMGLDSHHNDQWVFPKSIDSGININAGRVYLPDEVRVDPRNGSKYQLDENRVPIKEGENYKLAENTVSAREYWEKYFEDNPDQKPKHIIWYSGVPWLYQDHRKNDYDEFPEHQDVPSGHDNLRTAFYNLGSSVIDEYYGVKPKASI